MGGQSLEDKLYAVKYFISGQCLSFVVLKATTSELLGPKKKHLNYLVTITNEPNVSIPSLVKYLMRRARHPDWSVAFKAIISIHHLMSYGNEKFIQNMASNIVNQRTFDQLASFSDRSSSQAYDMSTFVRRYSRYINTKIQTYKSLGVDFCNIVSQTRSRGSPLKIRSMLLEEVMSNLPIIQNQLDSLLAFDASSKDLNNGIINSAFSMLYKDFVKLYIVYQAAIIRLLELYFTLNQVKRVQELHEAYKKFLIRMDKVTDFMRVIDSVGMDKSDMPKLSLSPEQAVPLKLLERHLNQLQGDHHQQQQQQQLSASSSSLLLSRLRTCSVGSKANKAHPQGAATSEPFKPVVRIDESPYALLSGSSKRPRRPISGSSAITANKTDCDNSFSETIKELKEEGKKELIDFNQEEERPLIGANSGVSELRGWVQVEL